MSTTVTSRTQTALANYLAKAQPAERRLAPWDPIHRSGDAPNSSDSLDPELDEPLTAARAVQLFEDQVLSRELDLAVRRLKQEGASHHAGSSAGHEQNAVLGSLLRPTDPCFLHHRSGAFMAARWRAAGHTPSLNTLLSACASSDDPISQGRHKAWGSCELWVPPQTATVGSHLPKAVGAAYALARSPRLGVEPRGRAALPSDSLVACTFGDASVNHASALAGINSARYARRHGSPTPVLFVCEDNQRGLSVDTPHRWISDLFAPMTHLEYCQARGNMAEIWSTAQRAIRLCREERVPVFLHLECTRLWGHDEQDDESKYRSNEEVLESEAKDPLLANARFLVESGAATPEDLIAIFLETQARVAAVSEEALERPKLSKRATILQPLALSDEDRAVAMVSRVPNEVERRELFDGRLPEEESTASFRTMGAHINAALHDLMKQFPETLVFGQDVGKKGGIYGLTAKLQQRFGVARVFDTLRDETTILGVAQGSAHVGFTPICEVQQLANLHNALDQLRGEAAALSFYSNGQFQNPMVVRVPSFAHQLAMGGQALNDNSFGALRDIPGLLLAAPSRGDDAVRMLRGAVALARSSGRVVCFLEPIALYDQQDLFDTHDNLWLCDYPAPGDVLLPGTVGLYGGGEDHENGEPQMADLLIISYANGLRISLRAAKLIEEEYGLTDSAVNVRVLDLRWLNPLPQESLLDYANLARNILVVDECRATGGGIADAVAGLLLENKIERPFASVRAADSFVPFGPASEAVLINEDQVMAAAKELLP